MNIFLVCLIAATTFARGQLVQVGTSSLDPNYCDKLTVDPNLDVQQDSKISGRVIDQSGAPFQNSPVALRLYISATKQTAVMKVMTDRDGQFRFDLVKAGKYRLIALRRASVAQLA